MPFVKNLENFIDDVTSDQSIRGFVADIIEDKIDQERESHPHVFKQFERAGKRDFGLKHGIDRTVDDIITGGRKAKRTSRARTRSVQRTGSILDVAGKRPTERPFDARGLKRVRKNLFGKESPIPTMPHGRQRTMRSRGSVKARSRNLQSQISLGRPMRSLARRSTIAEVKYLTGTLPMTNGSMLQLSAITQGVSHLTRVGDDVKVLALNANYQVFKDVGSNAADIDQWRLTVFQWHPNNTVPPVPADIFDDNPAARPSRQFFNLSRKPLYKILYDATGTLTGQFAAPLVGTSVTGVVKIGLTPSTKVLNFDPAITTGADQIYVLFQSFNATSPGSSPNGDITWRITYIDS